MRSRTMKLLSLALAVCLLLCGCNLIRTDPEYVKQQEAEKAAAEQAAYEADMATVLATYYGDRVVTKRWTPITSRWTCIPAMSLT